MPRSTRRPGQHGPTAPRVRAATRALAIALFAPPSTPEPAASPPRRAPPGSRAPRVAKVVSSPSASRGVGEPGSAALLEPGSGALLCFDKHTALMKLADDDARGSFAGSTLGLLDDGTVVVRKRFGLMDDMPRESTGDLVPMVTEVGSPRSKLAGRLLRLRHARGVKSRLLDLSTPVIKPSRVRHPPFEAFRMRYFGATVWAPGSDEFRHPSVDWWRVDPRIQLTTLVHYQHHHHDYVERILRQVSFPQQLEARHESIQGTLTAKDLATLLRPDELVSLLGHHLTLRLRANRYFSSSASHPDNQSTENAFTKLLRILPPASTIHFTHSDVTESTTDSDVTESTTDSDVAESTTDSDVTGSGPRCSSGP